MQGFEAIRQRFQLLAPLGQDRDAMLVKDTSTGKILVEKHLATYDPLLFRSLMQEPVEGTPKVEALVDFEGCLTVWEEYIQGKTLEAYLEERHVLPEQEGVAIIKQLLTILDRLHSRPHSIIHRDIKPSNVMLTTDGKIRLIDFDAARFHTPERSQDTQALGTVGYAAPEQYGFASSGPHTDLYATGVLLNRMLTGSMPQEAIYEGKCEGFIRTCLQMDADNRFPSAKIALEALDKQWKDTVYHKDAHNWHRFLPPGFRTLKVWKMLLALPYYWFTFNFVRIVDSSDGDTTTLALWESLVLNGIVYILFLTPVVFCCNYLNIQHPFRLDRIQRPFLRFLAAFGMSYILLSAFGIILQVILMYFGIQ